MTLRRSATTALQQQAQRCVYSYSSSIEHHHPLSNRVCSGWHEDFMCAESAGTFAAPSPTKQTRDKPNGNLLDEDANAGICVCRAFGHLTALARSRRLRRLHRRLCTNVIEPLCGFLLLRCVQKALVAGKHCQLSRLDVGTVRVELTTDVLESCEHCSLPTSHCASARAGTARVLGEIGESLIMKLCPLRCPTPGCVHQPKCPETSSHSRVRPVNGTMCAHDQYMHCLTYQCDITHRYTHYKQ